MIYSDFFTKILENIKKEGIYREFTNISRICGNFPKALNNQNGQENVARGVVYQIDENEKTAIFIKHFLLDEDALCCGSFQLLNQGAILSGGSEGTIYEFVDELSSPNLKIDIGGIVYRAVKIER